MIRITYYTAIRAVFEWMMINAKDNDGVYQIGYKGFGTLTFKSEERKQ